MRIVQDCHPHFTQFETYTTSCGYFSLDRMLVNLRVMSFVPIYTPGWRETMWSKVNCPRKQHDGRASRSQTTDLQVESHSHSLTQPAARQSATILLHCFLSCVIRLISSDSGGCLLFMTLLKVLRAKHYTTSPPQKPKL